jgi:hypothetical protein
MRNKFFNRTVLAVICMVIATTTDARPASAVKAVSSVRKDRLHAKKMTASRAENAAGEIKCCLFKE